jgi:ATP-dependent DNA helicase RecG
VQPVPFHAALEALAKPLEFAVGDDFANADRITGLEETIRTAAQRAAALSIPDDAREILDRVAKAFREPLDSEDRRAALRDSLESLTPLRAPDYPDRALARSVSTLPGVGPRRADTLARRGLRQIVDLLFHLPTRYDDRRTLQKIGALQVGTRATFVGEVLLADHVSIPPRGRNRGRRMFQAVISDGTGTVNLKWFRGGDSLAKSVKKGVRVRATGEVRRYRFDKEIVHPEFDLVSESGADDVDAGAETEGLVPVYTAPEGIPPRTFRGWVGRAVAGYSDLVPSTLPETVVRERSLPPTAVALREIHEPPLGADPEGLQAHESAAHERLVLEELYLLELGLALRHAERARVPGIAIVGDAAVDRALAALPFELTGAQQRAWAQIQSDLAQAHPMSRLLQGDVGSGKTVVAALAAVAGAAVGCQTALMAPTELLAEQHARTLKTLLAGAPEVRIALLTSSVPKPAAREIREALASGEIDLVVGTHSLVQDDVTFKRLAIVVVDEQHRFGVMQRLALAAKAPGEASPHTLVMTATPIPRSLALTVYGDLDVSVIDELPPGRTPARTALLRSGEGQRVMEEVTATLARGEQVYVVYPLVEESEKVDLRAATDQAEAIAKAFPEVRVDLVHGRLDAPERAEAMTRFSRGETAILVSTTVIEVGVDIANATLMVIEHAERFGLAQLHQLRGRVGRGDRPGTCLLVARGGSEDSEARLRAMLETTDGFRIADADLEIRGPGDFLGTRQSGKLPDLRFADLVRDARLVAIARDAARAEVRKDPGLAKQPQLAVAVETRWGDRLDLVGVG